LRLLLDTHIVLWVLTEHEALSKSAWRLLNHKDNELFVSAVSIWEIAIKHARRRSPADMPISGSQALEFVESAKFELLAINHGHAAAVDTLPMHHKDPFDRLLIAQAKTEPLVLLTHDGQLAAYGDFVMLV
jgi:PIN domain nuclease of toxin-antitoxin system